MARLILSVGAALFLWSSPAGAAVDRWSPFISEASVRYGIPEAWIRRVMRAESGGRTMLHGRPIVSRAGAMGLMQLMPGTWAAVRAAERLGPDPHDPRDNILAGAAYLRLMYDRFGYPGLFGAYNAGPARYAAHLERGRPLPRETIEYLRSVAGTGVAATRPSAPTPAAAQARTVFAIGGSSAPSAASASAVFVPLSAGGLQSDGGQRPAAAVATGDP